MKYAKLGNSDLNVSQISFGCMSLGADHSENEQLIHRAIELGINTFDTADLYAKGFNEETLGAALKGKREKVIIATKVGNQWRKDGSGWDWNPRKAYIKKAVHESLDRLQTDYIDLYQLHGGTIDDPIDEAIEAFEELKSGGYIRAYGISSIRPNVIREWAKKSNMVSVMMQYSLLDKRAEENCLDFLKDQGIGVIVRGALAKGLLAGKPPTAYLNHSNENVQNIQNLLASMEDENRKMRDLALQYVLSNPAVSTIASGIRTMNQLEENASIFNLPFIEPNKFRVLQSDIESFQYEVHR
ncbi:MAG: aldo/keto reductase [Saprospiraceae bacterium]|jgi:aryl-alcohol dehydrogenase-like predicted oxidoreductase|nr:aldo/keto reductase [Saprospiraceae bacterium]